MYFRLLDNHHQEEHKLQREKESNYGKLNYIKPPIE